jgi:hypothetical protein
MSLPQLDHPDAEPTHDERALTSHAGEGSEPLPVAAEPELPARVNAERAISEFRSMIFDMTYDQAREAYMRLLVGRGFSKSKRLPMVISSGATPPPPAPTNPMPTGTGLTDSTNKPSPIQEAP